MENKTDYFLVSPNFREILLLKSEEDYNKNKKSSTVFHQVVALYQFHQERFFCESFTNTNQLKTNKSDEHRTNLLLNYAHERIHEPASNTSKESSGDIISADVSYQIDPETNFLANIENPDEGIVKIAHICNKMPSEWTILQLCKGPRSDTSHSFYQKIYESDSSIYLSILKHARSNKYPRPICIRINSELYADVFRRFSSMANHFKKCVKIDLKYWDSKEVKMNYWRNLEILSRFMDETVEKFKTFFQPWNFLFTGISYDKKEVQDDIQTIWKHIDSYCQCFKLSDDVAVILSLLVLNLEGVIPKEVRDICKELDLREHHILKLISIICGKTKKSQLLKKPKNNYPCMLIIDQYLDHFYWEQLNRGQEFCRFGSLQSLWELYRHYRTDIHYGYLKVNINNGLCLVNPANNLPRMSKRMNKFFEYWTPHWKKFVDTMPNKENLLEDIINHDCYVFAGHGSGLQHILFRKIMKKKIKTVMFLFGCDSVRLHSTGLYSEMLGPHMYFLAAKCPAVIGTLMPGLDAHMDRIAAELLSRWITSSSLNSLSWYNVDKAVWTKSGEIIAEENPKHKAKRVIDLYQKGSLCSLIADIHRYADRNKLYNTVSYVYRGLPVWNCSVEPLQIS